MGHSALGYRRPEMEVVPALRDGLYDDVDVLNALWDHAIRCMPEGTWAAHHLCAYMEHGVQITVKPQDSPVSRSS